VISLQRHIPEKRYSIKAIAQMGWRHKKMGNFDKFNCCSPLNMFARWGIK
jgi:hypothetical protein